MRACVPGAATIAASSPARIFRLLYAQDTEVAHDPAAVPISGSSVGKGIGGSDYSGRKVEPRLGRVRKSSAGRREIAAGIEAARQLMQIEV